MASCMVANWPLTLDVVGPPPGLESIGDGAASSLKTCGEENVTADGILRALSENMQLKNTQIAAERANMQLQVECMQYEHANLFHQLQHASTIWPAQPYLPPPLPLSNSFACAQMGNCVIAPPGNFHAFHSGYLPPSSGEIFSPHHSFDHSSGSELDSPVAAAAPAVVRKVVVENFVDAEGNHGQRVTWTVDAHKLRSNDTHATSPSFDLVPGVKGKLMLQPKAMGTKKGHSAFKKSKGCGSIELKFEAESSTNNSPMTFFLHIGSDGLEQPRRGPVTHSFDHGCVCGLPKEEDEWDFNVAVDRKSQTFTVHMEFVQQAPL